MIIEGSVSEWLRRRTRNPLAVTPRRFESCRCRIFFYSFVLIYFYIAISLLLFIYFYYFVCKSFLKLYITWKSCFFPPSNYN